MRGEKQQLFLQITTSKQYAGSQRIWSRGLKVCLTDFEGRCEILQVSEAGFNIWAGGWMFCRWVLIYKTGVGISHPGSKISYPGSKVLKHLALHASEVSYKRVQMFKCTPSCGRSKLAWIFGRRVEASLIGKTDALTQTNQARPWKMGDAE